MQLSGPRQFPDGERRPVTVGVDSTVPHPARIYDFILGGTSNFAADREAARAAIAANPYLAVSMRENRALMRRMTAFLAGEAGISQFLDLGSGLPTSPNLHEVAQVHRPDARVVYVDHDPIVLAQARGLLTSDPAGATMYLHADLRDPDAILADPRLQDTLDLSEPVALTLFGVLQFVADEDGPHAIVARLVDALPSGSYLALQHPTSDFYPPGRGAARSYQRSGIPFRYRDRAEFARLLEGLDLVPPGIEVMTEWRAEGEQQPRPSAEQAGAYAAIGRKA